MGRIRLQRNVIRGVLLTLICLGCTKTNDDNWKITSPGAGYEIQWRGQQMSLVVSGTVDKAYASNNILLLDSDDAPNPVPLSSPASFTSSGGPSPNLWSVGISIIGMPQGNGPQAAAICTGNPAPNLTGQGITGFCKLDVTMQHDPNN